MLSHFHGLDDLLILSPINQFTFEKKMIKGVQEFHKKLVFKWASVDKAANNVLVV